VRELNREEFATRCLAGIDLVKRKLTNGWEFNRSVQDVGGPSVKESVRSMGASVDSSNDGRPCRYP